RSLHCRRPWARALQARGAVGAARVQRGEIRCAGRSGGALMKQKAQSSKWKSKSKGRSTDMKQPGRGIVATILVMAIALGFVSLFSFPTFAGWVAYFLLCVIPIQIVMAVTWGTEQPRAAAKGPQPMRGVLLTLFALVVGVVVATLALRFVGA